MISSCTSPPKTTMGGELAGGPTPNDDLVIAPRFVRRNGLQRPFDPLQIASWVIITMLVASFCFLLMPMVPNPWKLISLVVYLVCLVGVLGSGFETGRCDPVDPYVHAPEEELDKLPDLLKCNACRSRVNKLSRHCLICDKCVVDYDHHCKWLNNCIGLANYKSFICLIVSTLLLVGLQLLTSTALFITYIIDLDQLASDLSSSSLALDKEAFLGLLAANIFIGVPACMMVAHLVGFHIFLAYHGLTTYNYVMQTQAAEEAKNRAKSYEDDELSTSTEEDSELDEEDTPDDKKSSHGLDGDTDAPPQMQHEVDVPEKRLTIPALEQSAIPIVDEKSLDAESNVCVQADSIPGQLDVEEPVGSRRGPVRLAPLSGSRPPTAGGDLESGLPMYSPPLSQPQ